MAVRIGELLLKEKRITPAQLQEALNFQKSNGGKLGLNLVKLGYVKDEEITALLSKQYGVPSINLAQFEIDPGIIKLIPSETAHKYQIVPLSRSGATLTIAMTDPTNVFAMDDIKFMTGLQRRAGRRVRDGGPRGDRSATTARRSRARPATAAATSPRTASLEMVTRALEETSSITDDDVEVLEELEQIDVASLERQGGEAPVIRLVNLMLMSAIQKGASDIHIEPVREGAAHPLPHRRHPLQRDGAADEVPRRDHVAREDHGEARHRREAAAAGRTHQDPLRRQRRHRGRSTSASRVCRRCSARRSSCVCSTRTS